MLDGHSRRDHHNQDAHRLEGVLEAIQELGDAGGAALFRAYVSSPESVGACRASGFRTQMQQRIKTLRAHARMMLDSAAFVSKVAPFRLSVSCMPRLEHLTGVEQSHPMLAGRASSGDVGLQATAGARALDSPSNRGMSGRSPRIVYQCHRPADRIT